MPYKMPTFNLTANVWTSQGTKVYVPPPRLVVQCALRLYKTAFLQQVLVNGVIYPLVMLQFPKGTDIRPGWGLAANVPATPDVIEVPAGTGRFYGCVAIEDVAKGWANEYRAACCYQNFYTGAFPIR